MNEQGLKALENLGVELGAAKAEVERLREALRPFAVFEAVRSKQGGCTPKRGTAWAVASAGEEAEITVEHLQASVSALSQQAEPKQSREAEGLLPEWWMEQHTEPSDTYTAVDMATAAAQGFRDGQAAVEPAPAQDEREAFEQHYHRFDLSRDPVSGAYFDSEVRCLWDAWQARATRPAQTEQQPEQSAVRSVLSEMVAMMDSGDEPGAGSDWHVRAVAALAAAPIAQTAPQPEQSGLVEALEEIASGLQAEFAWEVAEQALAAYRAALSAQGQKP